MWSALTVEIMLFTRLLPEERVFLFSDIFLVFQEQKDGGYSHQAIAH